MLFHIKSAIRMKIFFDISTCPSIHAPNKVWIRALQSEAFLRELFLQGSLLFAKVLLQMLKGETKAASKLRFSTNMPQKHLGLQAKQRTLANL